MKSKRLIATLAATGLVMSLGITAAAGDHGGQPPITAPAVATCTGTADVWTGPDAFDPNDPDQQGLTFPHVDLTPRHFSFELATTCDVRQSDLTTHEDVSFSARGTGTGWCGHSTAPADDETDLHHADTNDGELGAQHLDNIEWTSGGSVLAVTFTHDAGGSGDGAAVVEAFGGADCTTLDGANSFEVVIVAEIN